MKVIVEEMLRIRALVVRILLLFIVVFSSLLVFGRGEYEVFGEKRTFLSWENPSLAMEFFSQTKELLVPEGIPIVTLNPFTGFIAPILFAVLLAILLVFPFAILSIARFLAPALYSKERRSLAVLLMAAVILFYLGCAFAYFTVIPETFSFLYSFSEPYGIMPFFSLESFISSVFFLTVAVGMMFLLPVMMILLSNGGVVPKIFWRRHWRGALVTMLVFSAVITPDGSGVTMVMLVFPLVILYGIGMIGSSGQKRRSEEE